MDFSSFFDYPEKDLDDSQPAVDYVFLPAWDNAAWTKFLNFTQTHVFSKGDIVIKSGDVERALYLIGSGTLEVLIPKAGGGDNFLRVATLESGTVMGEQAFLDGQARSATIRAMDDCQLYMFSYASFEIFAAREPQLAHELLFDIGRIISLRLRDTMRFLPTGR